MLHYEMSPKSRKCGKQYNALMYSLTNNSLSQSNFKPTIYHHNLFLL